MTSRPLAATEVATIRRHAPFLKSLMMLSRSYWSIPEERRKQNEDKTQILGGEIHFNQKSQKDALKSTNKAKNTPTVVVSGSGFRGFLHSSLLIGINEDVLEYHSGEVGAILPPCSDMQGYEAFIRSLSSPSACSCLSTKMMTEPFSW